tara:strand:+ start:9117 stop:10187 length:1071 start_codon:yes stop_codon:yes gene_type:complete
MAVKSSGSPLSFSEIETEFGQNNDRDLGEYRVSQTVGGLSNQPLDTGIPQSGAIKFSEFYDKRLNVVIDYHSGSTENRPTVAKTRYDASAGTGTHTVIGGFATRPTNSGGTKTRIHVNKTIGSSTGNINNCAVRTGTGWNSGTVLTVEVSSSGAIYGAGGDGGEAGTSDGDASGDNGGSGSSGLGVQFTGTTVINNGIISAGYGGGGGGGYRKVEREESFGGPVYAASGGGGGGGQGLPAGEGIDGGADGTTTAGGNGGNGGENNQAHGGGGGGGGSNGTGGEGGNSNDGGNGTASAGGNGASGTHTGSIEGENNVTGGGGTGGGNGAAIRRTSGITVNITNNATITGGTTDTGVS